MKTLIRVRTIADVPNITDSNGHPALGAHFLSNSRLVNGFRPRNPQPSTAVPSAGGVPPKSKSRRFDIVDATLIPGMASFGLGL